MPRVCPEHTNARTPFNHFYYILKHTHIPNNRHFFFSFTEEMDSTLQEPGCLIWTFFFLNKSFLRIVAWVSMCSVHEKQFKCELDLVQLCKTQMFKFVLYGNIIFCYPWTILFLVLRYMLYLCICVFCICIFVFVHSAHGNIIFEISTKGYFWGTKAEHSII